MGVKLFPAIGLLLFVACGSDDSEDKGGEPTDVTGTVALGGECSVRADCKDAFADCRCEGYGTTQCVAIPPGSECPQKGCGPDTLCIGGVCLAYVPKGGACGNDLGRCVAGSACSNGVCGAQKAEGESCNANEPEPCVPGFYCDGSTCVARAPMDAPCELNRDSCLDGVCASVGAAPRCYPKVPSGEICVHASQCPAGFTCDGRCKKPPPDSCF